MSKKDNKNSVEIDGVQYNVHSEVYRLYKEMIKELTRLDFLNTEMNKLDDFLWENFSTEVQGYMAVNPEEAKSPIEFVMNKLKKRSKIILLNPQ